MTLHVKFNKPEIKSSLDWQLIQEINLLDDNNNVIAKAEIELITLNKHRDAVKSYTLLDADDETTDWELPLNLYFKGQNLSTDMCQLLDVTPETKKAKTHMLIEAMSVAPSHRKQGVAKRLLKEIAAMYPKVQSITAMSMPMSLFVDANDCEDSDAKAYYESLELKKDETSKEQLHEFFTHSNFTEYKVNPELLAEPLVFEIFVSTPEKLMALKD